MIDLTNAEIEELTLPYPSLAAQSLISPRSCCGIQATRSSAKAPARKKD